MEDALATATTDELIGELQKRYLAVLVTWIKKSKNDEEYEDLSFSYSGGMTQAVGMASRVHDTLLADSRDALDRADEEE